MSIPDGVRRRLGAAMGSRVDANYVCDAIVGASYSVAQTQCPGSEFGGVVDRMLFLAPCECTVKAIAVGPADEFEATDSGSNTCVFSFKKNGVQFATRTVTTTSQGPFILAMDELALDELDLVSLTVTANGTSVHPELTVSLEIEVP